MSKKLSYRYTLSRFDNKRIGERFKVCNCIFCEITYVRHRKDWQERLSCRKCGRRENESFDEYEYRERLEMIASLNRAYSVWGF